eukprot:Gb_28978 [translate_table: standard]
MSHYPSSATSYADLIFTPVMSALLNAVFVVPTVLTIRADWVVTTANAILSVILYIVGTDPADVSNIQEALAEGKSYCGRLLNYKKDGTPFWNLLTIAPIKDETGKILKFIGLTPFTA